MKKLILLIAISLFMLSCGQAGVGGDRTENRDDKYSIVVIDSCEYIECDYGILDQRIYSLTHKGNCKFCSKRMPEYLK